jgi:hypothetical protein
MSLAERDRASKRSPSAQADTAAQIGWTGYDTVWQESGGRLRSFSVTQHLVGDKSPAGELRSQSTHCAIRLANRMLCDALVRRTGRGPHRLAWHGMADVCAACQAWACHSRPALST